MAVLPVYSKKPTIHKPFILKLCVGVRVECATAHNNNLPRSSGHSSAFVLRLSSHSRRFARKYYVHLVNGPFYGLLAEIMNDVVPISRIRGFLATHHSNNGNTYELVENSSIDPR